MPHREAHLHFRKIWDPPVLLVDWEKLNVERKPAWAELFYDLIFVAATSSITRIFYVDTSVNGFISFFVYWTIFWFLWSKMNAYQTRFTADSLIHQLCMFVHEVKI